ncbi:MAG TPA: VOC family protein [Thermoanaerobaculia bacterium]|jgi:lactoylglutathione lyase|nr:VOC family protein [Thermoanaerobaculia bacterium]
MAAKKTSKSKKAAKKPAKRAAAKRAPAKSAKDEKTLRLASASPSLTVNDVHLSLAWYRDVLGFVPGERWEHEGKLLGIEMNAGAVSFMIGQDDWKKGRDRIKGVGVRIFCMTDQDIDRLATRIKANGGTLSSGPTDQPWGMRELSIDDPDGYKITIAKELKKR